jgi:hypothetical protein
VRWPRSSAEPSPATAPARRRLTNVYTVAGRTQYATALDRHLLYWPQPIPVRAQGEVEAAVSEEISRFEQDYMGRGPNRRTACHGKVRS